MSKPEAMRGADMQELIKRLAVEAGGVPMRENCLDAEAFPWGVEMEIDALERFAQAVARECIEIYKHTPPCDEMSFTDAIRARFGIKGE